MQKNPILDSSNEPIKVSNLFGRFNTNTLDGLPLGTIGESALGELFLKVGVIGGIAITGAQLTPTSTLATTGTTVAAGKKHIEFIFSADYTGNVNGIAYVGANDAVQSFDAPLGSTLAAIVFTVTAGSVRIITF